MRKAKKVAEGEANPRCCFLLLSQDGSRLLHVIGPIAQKQALLADKQANKDQNSNKEDRMSLTIPEVWP